MPLDTKFYRCLCSNFHKLLSFLKCSNIWFYLVERFELDVTKKMGISYSQVRKRTLVLQYYLTYNSTFIEYIKENGGLPLDVREDLYAAIIKYIFDLDLA